MLRMLESKLELALVQVQEMQREREHFEEQLTHHQTAANIREVRALREHIEQLEVRKGLTEMCSAEEDYLGIGACSLEHAIQCFITQLHHVETQA